MHILHREAITYTAILDTPYRIFSALIRHLGIIDSRKLWCRLIKFLTIVRKASIEAVLEEFVGNEQPGSLEAIEAKWAAMGVLALLVITWIKLGGQHSVPTSDDNHNKSIRVILSITGGSKTS